MHDPALPPARRGGMELGVVSFDELEFAWWTQPLPPMDALVHALTDVAAAPPPMVAGVADPHLLDPVDQGAFERAAAAGARPRPGISVLGGGRLADCVRALADGRPPRQTLATARAREPFDGLVDHFRPFTMPCVRFGRAVGRSEALRAVRRGLE